MAQTIVITGANRGIGLALVREYLSRGETIIGVCRRRSEELENTGVRIIEGVDVATDEGIALLKEQLADTPIDILINNAGILRASSLGHLDYADIMAQFQVNAMGPLRVTEALLPNLKSGSKVALITSRMGSIADNNSGGTYGYRMSKTALNSAGKSLAMDLKPKGIAVALLHPGWVSTEMVNFNGQIEPEESAHGLVQRIDALNIDNTGGFWHSNGDALPW
jgi:NAD(P)-dependent dehydrogenase (short-subunit alcohol dehydrogenase family)